MERCRYAATVDVIERLGKALKAETESLLK